MFVTTLPGVPESFVTSMSKSSATTDTFLLLLRKVAAQSDLDSYVCKHNDGGYIHPLTADLVRKTRLEIDHLHQAESRLGPSAALARTITFMLQNAMSETERGWIVSDPEKLSLINRVFADSKERERDITQRRQALSMSLQFVRESLDSQLSLCEHLAEEYKLPVYTPSTPPSDTGGSSY